MKITKLSLHNYKSLRAVAFTPRNLSVLVGPNGAGKSNFCDAIDFIGEMYQLGLEYAVARHGGYENIAYRHTRRSKSPIRLEVTASLSEREISQVGLGNRKSAAVPRYTVLHSLAFATPSQRIESPFSIVDESICVTAITRSSTAGKRLIYFRRQGNAITDSDVSGLAAWLSRGEERDLYRYLRRQLEVDWSKLPMGDTQSLSTLLEARLAPFLNWRQRMGAMALFQVSPMSGREPGVTTPQPQLGRNGSNLPAVLQFTKEHHPEQFQALLNTLKQVMPTLEDVGVTFTPQRTQALTFKEAGFGRSWSAEEVSDGTVRTLALLTATLDPEYQFTVIEEPENSLHPWAIRQFVDACRAASKSKQIVLTTHSPTLVNQMEPAEIWIVSRKNGETQDDRLLRNVAFGGRVHDATVRV